jgi:hypothetical protein
MGDRANITFTDGSDFSPTVYLHWNGSDAEKLLREAMPKMRAGDLGYAVARFVGHCCEKIPGPLSLGLFNGPESADQCAKQSPGDAGAILVNICTGDVQTFGGYTKPFKLETKAFARA